MLTLYTFNISHFSEKVRWALDYERIVYHERVLLPGAHIFVTRQLARRTHVPVLKDGDQVVQGSSAILDYLATQWGSSRLTPQGADARALAFEREKQIDYAFGRGVQRLTYAALLHDRKATTELWMSGGPAWGRAWYALTYPLLAKFVRRVYKTSDAGALTDAKRLFAVMFDQLDEALTQQPYLGGNQPSRVDITAASLLAPLCRPPQHRVPWPELPPDLAAFVADFHDRPTWKHALRMYAQHRAPETAVPASIQDHS